MLTKQRGASFWQWLIIGGMAGVFLYAGLMLTPIYMEGMSVRKALLSVEKSNVGRSQNEILKKIQANFQIDQVERATTKDIKFKNLRNGKLEVSIEYNAKVQMFGNLYLLVEFRESVEV
ncbi:DUF4845 domain-containing protein [Pleionea sediminis]|uniref:DUF4845 domain-containing protein n=1 Tax=Pleionea sediminis TaxID=2569479 RepID=UPI0011871CF7|nr:DUF4845 domain-containing protein [Pleionea sediminis]